MARNKTTSSIDRLYSLLYGDQSKNFPPKVEEDFKQGLREKIDELTEAQARELDAIVTAYSQAYQESDNVLKVFKKAQESKIDFVHPSRGVEEKPGSVDFSQAAELIASRFPLKQGAKDNAAYHYKNERYGIDTVNVDKPRVAINNLKQYKGPIAFVRPVGSGELDIISRAHQETSTNLALQTKRLFHFLEHKQDISDKEKSKYNIETSDFGAKLRQFSGKALRTAYKPLDLMLRGLTSSDPANLSEFKRFNKNRDALMTHLLWKYAPNNGARAQIMMKLKHILYAAQEDEHGMLDKESFEALMKLISEEVDQDNVHLKEVTKKMNELYAGVFDLAKEKSAKSDELWKFRAIQMLLLVTPFAGISLFTPFLGALGSVFNAGISGGAVEIMRSLGPFSYIIELLRIDVALEWLLSDSPFIGDLIGIVDSILMSEPAQNLTGNMLMPVLFAPLFPLAVAGAVSFARIPTEYDFYVKYKEAFKAKEEALNKEIKELLDQEDLRNKDAKWIENFVKKKYDIFEQAFIHESFLNFVQYLDGHSDSKRSRLIDVFGEGLYKDLQNRGIFYDHRDGDYSVNYDTLSAFMFHAKDKESDLYNDIMNKFYAFNAAAFESENKEIDEIYNKFEKVSSDGQYIQKGKVILGQNFVLNMMTARGEVAPDDISYGRDLKVREEYVKDYKEKIIKKETGHFKEILENANYNSANLEGVDIFAVKPEAQKLPGTVVKKVTEFKALEQENELYPMEVDC